MPHYSLLCIYPLLYFMQDEDVVEKDAENEKTDDDGRIKHNRLQFLHTCPFTQFLHRPKNGNKIFSKITFFAQFSDDHVLHLVNFLDPESKKAIFNIKYPKIFQKRSETNPEATLASMETLEDKLDTPNDGMENVKLEMVSEHEQT